MWSVREPLAEDVCASRRAASPARGGLSRPRRSPGPDHPGGHRVLPGHGQVNARSAFVAMPTTAGGSTVVQASCPKGTKSSPAASRPRPPWPRIGLESRAIAAGGNAGSWMGPGSRAPPPARLSPTSTAPRQGEEALRGTRPRSPLGSQRTAATRPCANKTSAKGAASRPVPRSAVCSTPASSTRTCAPAAAGGPPRHRAAAPPRSRWSPTPTAGSRRQDRRGSHLAPFFRIGTEGANRGPSVL